MALFNLSTPKLVKQTLSISGSAIARELDNALAHQAVKNEEAKTILEDELMQRKLKNIIKADERLTKINELTAEATALKNNRSDIVKAAEALINS